MGIIYGTRTYDFFSIPRFGNFPSSLNEDFRDFTASICGGDASGPNVIIAELISDGDSNFREIRTTKPRPSEGVSGPSSFFGIRATADHSNLLCGANRVPLTKRTPQRNFKKVAKTDSLGSGGEKRSAIIAITDGTTNFSVVFPKTGLNRGFYSYFIRAGSGGVSGEGSGDRNGDFFRFFHCDVKPFSVVGNWEKFK